jgi:hypothetical protein
VNKCNFCLKIYKNIFYIFSNFWYYNAKITRKN